MNADDDCRAGFNKASYTSFPLSGIVDLHRIVFSIGMTAAHRSTQLVIGMYNSVWMQAGSCVKMRFRRSSGKAKRAWRQ